MNDQRTGITQRELMDRLKYDRETGDFYWVRPSKFHIEKVGQIAGRTSDKKYIQITIDKKIFAAHRLAWLWVYGEMPSGQIDHINGVRNDNRIENLRDVVPSINAQNHRKTVRPRKQRNGRYQARIRAWGKTHYLGSFDTESQATEAYETARRELHDIPAIG